MSMVPAQRRFRVEGSKDARARFEAIVGAHPKQGGACFWCKRATRAPDGDADEHLRPDTAWVGTFYYDCAVACGSCVASHFGVQAFDPSHKGAA